METGYAYRRSDTDALHIYEQAIARAARLCDDKVHIVEEVLAHRMIGGWNDNELRSVLDRRVVQVALQEARSLCRRSLGRSIVHYYLRAKDKNTGTVSLDKIIALRDR